MENTAEKNIISLNGNGATLKQPAETYFKMGADETGSIEIDLISFRQKNRNEKYLTISITNPGQGGEPTKDNTFAIDNEEAFINLKKFFEQLSWNG